MRTDATFDKQQVRCKNASPGGFSKMKAQVGDIVCFTEQDVSSTGRMVARITYAPQIGNDPPIRNWILVVVLSRDLSHVYERWVDPNTVTRVEPMRNRPEVMGWFLSPDLTSDIEETRQTLTGGWSSLERYRKWKATR